MERNPPEKQENHPHFLQPSGVLHWCQKLHEIQPQQQRKQVKPFSNKQKQEQELLNHKRRQPLQLEENKTEEEKAEQEKGQAVEDIKVVNSLMKEKTENSNKSKKVIAAPFTENEAVSETKVVTVQPEIEGKKYTEEEEEKEDEEKQKQKEQKRKEAEEEKVEAREAKKETTCKFKFLIYSKLASQVI